MHLGLEGKNALVTGASRGLGRSIALNLAREGTRVAVVARNSSALSMLINEMGGEQEGHYAVVLDLMADGAPKKMAKELAQNFGPIEILVHNLGGTLGLRDALSSMEDYQKVWKFNMGIAIQLNRLFIPEMEKAKWGRIVHISSSSAVMADGSLPYSSAKAALNTYVKGLGREKARLGIIVSAVMPGPFMFTNSHWDNIAKNNQDRFDDFVNRRMAVRRIGTPEEISGIITFLCSEQASYFAGAVVPVDGGIY